MKAFPIKCADVSGILSTLLLAVVTASGPVAACTVPDRAAAAVDIYPTAEELPANLLRIYVYFPQPMQPTGILEHIALLDARGVEVPGVFLSNRYDLWSPDRRRLTVLFDPGRVKTGLAAHDALGRALEPGSRYSLVVRGSAVDARGCQLGTETEHAFTAREADIDPPRAEEWALTRPAAGTVEPFEVDLGSPHDHVSLAYRLRIATADGDVVPGRINLGPGEEVWSFTPNAPWTSGTYVLHVDARLEDLAGNRPGLLFDRPTTAAIEPAVLERAWTPLQNN